MELTTGTGTVYTLRWNGSTNLGNMFKSRTSRELIPFDVYDAYGALCGKLCKKRQGSSRKYFTYELELYGRLYVMYEVGLGEQGIKLPIYHGPYQIALGEKDPVTYDNKDGYLLSFDSDLSFWVAVLLSLHYDHDRYGNYGEVSMGSQKTRIIYSINNEVKSKYDPSWKYSG